ncbi:EboA domain-containing protein [Streptomyces sp. NPDC051636]|uniref:EboA domain-containing protein n=1 Tax=Streptomyces sp. NPDC051636 TaxID=3365663 RepID=UPI0037A67493
MPGGHLADVLKDQVADPAWLHAAERQVTQDPAAVAALFPAAGRRCGRGPLTDPGPELGGWTVDDAARVLLLTALPLRGAALAEQVGALYRNGGAAEKRAVLRALPGLDIGSGAADLLHDAIRTNDPRLIAAAVGPCARRLDDGMWRQAVLKCVFMDIPLTAVADLDRRADGELARMLADLDDERRAAGRTMPADATALLALIGDRAPARSGEREEETV